MAGHNKWSKVKHTKGPADAKRGRIFSKHSMDITVASREGGGDSALNAQLRQAIHLAKAANMPSGTIERAIKKGTGELDGAVPENVHYEGYAAGGVAYLFDRKGEIRVPATDLGEVALLEHAMKAGAEEVSTEEGEHIFLTAPDRLAAAGDALDRLGIEISSQKLTFVPQTEVSVPDAETARQVLYLYEKLDEYDDTQAVFANFDISNEVLKDAGDY